MHHYSEEEVMIYKALVNIVERLKERLEEM